MGPVPSEGWHGRAWSRLPGLGSGGPCQTFVGVSEAREEEARLSGLLSI